MAFNSFLYLVFFGLVLALVHLLRDRVTARNAVLLAASYFFYMCWDWRFLALILVSTAVDYSCGRALAIAPADVGEPAPRTRRRKAILLVSLITNLGLLGVFKYFNFFIDSAAAVLAALGLQPNVPSLRIILPVGISFYTFQTLSYTIDLYRGILPTERRLLNFALYVAFFPQLVAGPIERAKRLLPQIAAVRPVTRADLGSGAYLILWGLFKKVVIADNVAVFSDAAFANPTHSGLYSLLGVVAFTVQIYADFSAYSDIARGSARCLGFDLMLNFNLPYFCTNVGDFYRRWHISLSTWLRDYLYIPLGGSRVSEPRLYFNLMLTMLLGGLWHGASWTFVMWGAFQGILLCAHRALLPAIDAIKPAATSRVAGPWHLGSLLFFVPFTLAGRLLFRAESPRQVWDFTSAIFLRFPGPTPGWIKFEFLAMLASATAFLFAFQLLQYRTGDLNVVYRFPTPLRAAFYAGLFLSIVIFGSIHGTAFIYFQF